MPASASKVLSTYARARFGPGRWGECTTGVIQHGCSSIAERGAVLLISACLLRGYFLCWVNSLASSLTLVLKHALRTWKEELWFPTCAAFIFAWKSFLQHREGSEVSVTAVLLSPTATFWCPNLKSYLIHSLNWSFVQVSWPRQWLNRASEGGGGKVLDPPRVPLGIVIKVRKGS